MAHGFPQRKMVDDKRMGHLFDINQTVRFNNYTRFYEMNSVHGRIQKEGRKKRAEKISARAQCRSILATHDEHPWGDCIIPLVTFKNGLKTPEKNRP